MGQNWNRKGSQKNKRSPIDKNDYQMVIFWKRMVFGKVKNFCVKSPNNILSYSILIFRYFCIKQK